MGNKSLSPSLAAFGFTSNKPTTSATTADSSPSLAAFGFTSKKRKGGDNDDDYGDQVRPSKRSKTCDAVSGINSQDNTVDLSQEDVKMVDLSQDVSNDGSANNGSERPISGELKKGDKAVKTVEAVSQAKSMASSENNTENAPNSIGFVRVTDPNNILCTATVAKARSSSNHHNSADTTIPPLFVGATIGRFSNSATKDVNYVNIGIKADARGISRKHVSVLRINGLLLPGSDNNNDKDDDDDVSIVTAHSSNSVKSSASMQNQNNPTILIKVLEHPDPTKTTNHVVIHRTRRNKRRKLDLRQKECKTLRVGDVLEFRSDPENYYYCVVVFHRSDDTGGGGLVSKEPSPAVLEPKAINMDNFVDNSVETRTTRESESQSNVVDMTVDEEMAETKTEHGNKNLALTQDTIADEAKMTSTTNEQTEATKSETVVMAAADITIGSKATHVEVGPVNRSNACQENKTTGVASAQMDAEALVGTANAKTEPVHSSKSPTKADAIQPKVELKISPRKLATSAAKISQKLTVDPAQIVKKGDHVRVVYQLKDAFGIDHEEW